MTLRTDHVAGAVFVLFGVLVFALSGDLPTGALSMPGAGFLPKLIAALLILFGAVLAARARESSPFAAVDWSDTRHAGAVLLITAAATAAYTWLGFLTTMALLLVGLLVLVERRHPLRAALYGTATALLAYGLFATALKAPLPTGPLGF